LPGIERFHVRAPYPGERRLVVHVMEPHAIDPKLRHAIRDFTRVGMGRKTCAKRKIHPKDTEAFISFEEVPLLRDHKAPAAGRLVIQAAYIGDARAGIVPRQYEWK